jgi:hypothetical protein
MVRESEGSALQPRTVVDKRSRGDMLCRRARSLCLNDLSELGKSYLTIAKVNKLVSRLLCLEQQHVT